MKTHLFVFRVHTHMYVHLLKVRTYVYILKHMYVYIIGGIGCRSESLDQNSLDQNSLAKKNRLQYKPINGIFQAVVYLNSLVRNIAHIPDHRISRAIRVVLYCPDHCSLLMRSEELSKLLCMRVALVPGVAFKLIYPILLIHRHSSLNPTLTRFEKRTPVHPRHCIHYLLPCVLLHKSNKSFSIIFQLLK